MQPDLKYQKAIYNLILRIYFDTLALAEIKVKVQIFLLENLRPVRTDKWAQTMKTLPQ